MCKNFGTMHNFVRSQQPQRVAPPQVMSPKSTGGIAPQSSAATGIPKQKRCSKCDGIFAFTDVRGFSCPKCKGVLAPYEPFNPRPVARKVVAPPPWPQYVYRGELAIGRAPADVKSAGFMAPRSMTKLQLDDMIGVARATLRDLANDDWGNPKRGLVTHMGEWKYSKNQEDACFVSTGKTPADAYDCYLYLYRVNFSLTGLLLLSSWNKVVGHNVEGVHLYLDRQDDLEQSSHIAVIRVLDQREDPEVMLMTPIPTALLELRCDLDKDGNYIFEKWDSVSAKCSVPDVFKSGLQQKLGFTG